MCLLDLDHLDETFSGLWPLASNKSAWAVATFSERDHLKDQKLSPNKQLSERVRDFVEQQCGSRPMGKIQLLTHLKYFGYCFNPVSFYYCHDPDGRLVNVVAEVSNTPWEEMHCYNLHQDTKGVRADVHQPKKPYTHRYLFQKVFHVSPFMDMEHIYDFSFHSPGKNLQVNTTMVKDQDRWFSATLRMERREISVKNVLWLLLYFPFITIYIQILIHWEAIKLWQKKVPFHSHPEGVQTWASAIIGTAMMPFFYLRAKFSPKSPQPVVDNSSGTSGTTTGISLETAKKPSGSNMCAFIQQSSRKNASSHRRNT
mmetsp:Transcript_22375/g.35956  ORF Transcript_22375/g.35956 Transcript_22375/m.35956 type:complete len:313 (+) Transcript_22375:62-1000(+)